VYLITFLLSNDSDPFDLFLYVLTDRNWPQASG
jgi:hypothetical protein